MASTCYPLIRGRAMRVTKTDACGNRVLGPSSVAVSDGMISVQLAAQTVQGEAITVTNANGAQCINDTPAPQFTGFLVTATFCKVDPELFNLLTGVPLYMDADGELAIGFDQNDDIDLDGQGFGLELWSSVPTAACADTGLQSYGYFLLPFLKGGIIGDIEIANAAITFSLTGAQTKSGTPWGVGPYDVELDEAGEAGPMTLPVPTTNHKRQFITQVPPPTPACGAIALGVPATTITAGIPATLAPANSYAPLNLAGLTGVTASPLTLWTSGQYVLLRDGSHAHWNATAWAAGNAP